MDNKISFHRYGGLFTAKLKNLTIRVSRNSSDWTMTVHDSNIPTDMFPLGKIVHKENYNHWRDAVGTITEEDILKILK
jgi:hypothetical protein